MSWQLDYLIEFDSQEQELEKELNKKRQKKYQKILEKAEKSLKDASDKLGRKYEASKKAQRVLKGAQRVLEKVEEEEKKAQKDYDRKRREINRLENRRDEEEIDEMKTFNVAHEKRFEELVKRIKQEEEESELLQIEIDRYLRGILF